MQESGHKFKARVGYQIRLLQCKTLSQKQQNPIYQPNHSTQQPNLKKKNEEKNIIVLLPSSLAQLVLYCLLEFQQCFPYWISERTY